MRALFLHSFVLASVSALALAGCARQASVSETSVAAVALAPVAAPALTLQDRIGFFVNHARHSERDEVAKEIAAGIDVNQRDTLDQTALIAAVTQRNDEVVALLLNNHADPNIPDNAGWTPLIYGAYFGVEPTLLKQLVDHGANVNGRNDRGITALYLASATGHEAQVKFLLDHGADRSLSSTAGYTPVRIAQLKGLGKIVAMLDPSVAAASGGKHR